MQDHVSERFYDLEKADTYIDLIQSSLDRPQGCEQAWLLDSLAPVTAAPPHRIAARPRLTFRWFNMPRFPVPFLTWA